VFRRVDKSQSADADWLGLGLAVVVVDEIG